MFEAKPPTGFGEGFGAVAGAVVGHDARDVHAKFLEISDGGFQESDGALRALIGKDGDPGDAGMVVDGDMGIFPAGRCAIVALLALAGAAAGDAVA